MSMGRKLGTLLGLDGSVKAEKLPSGGGSGGGTTIVDNFADLTTLTGMTAGSQAYVAATNKLYFYNGVGWYLIATVQNDAPSAITGVNENYHLAIDGTPTVVTAVSTDPDGFPLTWSYSVTSGSLGSTATVTQVDNVFTITPGIGSNGTFTLSISATDGVNGTVSALSSFMLQVILINSKYTVLMMNASNTGSNHTFSDASNSNHPISINGSPTASTLSAYRHGGYSVKFDGQTSGDGLGINSTNATANFITGSSDFTIECWAYSNVNENNYIFDMYSPRLSIFYETSGTGAPDNSFGAYDSGYRGAAQSQSGGIANRWIHIAMVRISGTITVYNDGIAVFSWYNNGGLSGSGISIGSNSPSRTWNAPIGWKGYIQDFRIIDGTALYTTTFTPPTEILTAVAGTTLLTCQGPSLSDKSSNAYALENGGSASIASFNRFDHAPYLQGTNGSSVYFDGVSDFLSIADDADLKFGSGDFTLEMWYKGTDTDQYATLTAKGAGGFTSGDWSLMMNKAVAGDIAFYVHEYNGSVPMLITGDVSASDNAWVHIAVVRSGNDWNLYVNGVSEAYVDSSTTINDTSSVVLIGADHSYGRYLSGFISDYRIVKGTAVYTAAFTPPTEPLTATADTKFLLNPETSISDLSQTSLLKPFGNTVTSSSQVKFAGTRSVYFDGVGDYLTAPSSATMGIGTGDFTIECWFYATDGAIDVGVWDTHSQSSSSDGLTLTRITATTFRVWDSSQILVSSATAITDNWNHLAVVRNGGTLELFVNGVSQGTVSNSTNMNSAQEIVIGAGRYENSAAPTAFVKGYMQDFRITKGLARYTTNFTPSQIGELLG